MTIRMVIIMVVPPIARVGTRLANIIRSVTITIFVLMAAIVITRWIIWIFLARITNQCRCAIRMAIATPRFCNLMAFPAIKASHFLGASPASFLTWILGALVVALY